MGNSIVEGMKGSPTKSQLESQSKANAISKALEKGLIENGRKEISEKITTMPTDIDTTKAQENLGKSIDAKYEAFIVARSQKIDKNREATFKRSREGLSAAQAGMRELDNTVLANQFQRDEASRNRQIAYERRMQTVHLDKYNGVDFSTEFDWDGAVKLQQNLRSRSQQNELKLKQTIVSWLGFSGVENEVFGVQSSPGTMHDISGISSSLAGVSPKIYNGSLNLGKTIVSNASPWDSRYVFEITDTGQVVSKPVWNEALSPRTQANLVALEGLKAAPLISLIGTSLEYAAYNYVGSEFAASHDKEFTAQNFAVDAAHDGAKAVVSGAVGIGVGTFIGATAAGAAVGSVVPIIGTAVGAIVGLGVAAVTAWSIESAYSTSGSRNFWKSL
ncbi:hypothetical protein [Catenovulum sediminis]|uniref:hypothetical protein n=1 Tax=Catenovulum sediminis TaxID=1740262 RepID=UPI00163D754B|nr:hypothetical protein [Catenovulum sediminis]